jgi:hypothetical protein
VADETKPKKPSQWEPGQSGNPSGKPVGARNKVLIALDHLGGENAEKILAAAVKAAIGDEKNPPDLQAAGLILSRVWPARKGRPVVLDIPAIKTAADLPAALGAVTQAVADGTLTPDEGAALASILDAQRRGIETADLEARLIALEAHARG